MISLAQNTNTVFTKIIYHRRQMEKDLIGKLPLTSNRGNKYLFMIYDYNINMILIQPMKEYQTESSSGSSKTYMSTYSPGG